MSGTSELDFVPERPADIPQRVWQDAVLVNNGFFSGHRGLYVEDIARAILAERERCATAAEGFVYDATPVTKVREHIAAAIRKGDHTT